MSNFYHPRLELLSDSMCTKVMMWKLGSPSCLRSRARWKVMNWGPKWPWSPRLTKRFINSILLDFVNWIPGSTWWLWGPDLLHVNTLDWILISLGWQSRRTTTPSLQEKLLWMTNMNEVRGVFQFYVFTWRRHAGLIYAWSGFAGLFHQSWFGWFQSLTTDTGHNLLNPLDYQSLRHLKASKEQRGSVVAHEWRTSISSKTQAESVVLGLCLNSYTLIMFDVPTNCVRLKASYAWSSALYNPISQTSSKRIHWHPRVTKMHGECVTSHVITYGYSIDGSSRLQGFNVVDVWWGMWRGQSIHREISEIEREFGGDHVNAGLMFPFHIDRSSVIVCRPRCVQLPFWRFSAAHDQQMDALTV